MREKATFVLRIDVHGGGPTFAWREARRLEQLLRDECPPGVEIREVEFRPGRGTTKTYRDAVRAAGRSEHRTSQKATRAGRLRAAGDLYHEDVDVL